MDSGVLWYGKLQVKPGFFLLVSLHFFMGSCRAQIPGCTDPLANNYDRFANLNNGSCTYDPVTISPTSTIALNETLNETSGLFLWNGYLWTHNDNIDTKLYGLDSIVGDIKFEYILPLVENIDWEEASQDEEYIYIGDIGNNSFGNRTDLHFLRVDKSTLQSGEPLIDTIFFSYEDQIDFSPKTENNTDFDCEAFFLFSDRIFLLTKKWISGGTSIYSLPKIPGNHIAGLLGIIEFQGLVTGASFFSEKHLLTLCGYTGLLQPFLYLIYDFQNTDYFNCNHRRIDISLPFHQIEGIASLNGLKYYVTNERLDQSFIKIPANLHIIHLDEYLGSYLTDLNHRLPFIQNTDQIFLYPNPAGEKVIVSNIDHLEGSGYCVFDISGKKILSGILIQPVTIVSLLEIPKGLYLFKIEGSSSYAIPIIKS